MLWARDPANEEWRRMVGEATSQRSTRQRRCCSQDVRSRVECSRGLRAATPTRSRMGVPCGIESICSGASHMRPFSSMTKCSSGCARALLSWAEERRSAFVAANAARGAKDWAECDDASRFRDLDGRAEQVARTPWTGLPCRPLRARMAAPSGMTRKMNGSARRSFGSGGRRSVVVVARPGINLSRRDYQYPQDDERWVLERVWGRGSAAARR